MWVFAAETGAIAVGAGVIGKTIGVSAKIELIIRLVEITEARDQLCFIIAFEAGAWRNVEYTVSTVAEIRGVTASLHFDRINVLGINLRTEIAGDVGVRNGHAVHEPAYLVTAADVELVVREVRSRNVVRDHGEAVGPGRAGRLTDFLTVNDASWSYRLSLCRTIFRGDGDGLIL